MIHLALFGIIDSTFKFKPDSNWIAKIALTVAVGLGFG